jgi:hypothetical protein
VAGSPAYTELLEFNPSATSNNDDYIDSGAKAIAATPERVQSFGILNARQAQNWNPRSGVFDVQADY